MRRLSRKLPTWGVILLVGVILLLDYLEPTSTPDATTPAGRQEVSLQRVIDGDTLDVRTLPGDRLRIRLLGIDCMETYHEEKMQRQAKRWHTNIRTIEQLGAQGKDALQHLVRPGSLVFIQPEGLPAVDDYGRSLGYIESGGEDVALSILKRGLAETRREPHPRASVYQSAARDARRADLGLYHSAK